MASLTAADALALDTLMKNLTKEALHKFIPDLSRLPNVKFDSVPYSPGAAFQSQDRLKRVAPVDDPSKVNWMHQYMLKPNDYLGVPMWSGHGTGRSRVDPPFNYVRAFAAAKEKCDNIRLGDICPPDLYLSNVAAYWLFGPNNEATTYAIVDAIEAYYESESAKTNVARALRGSGEPWSFTLQGVSFVATPLLDKYALRFSAPINIVFHTRFKTYRDMNRWADYAAQDRTPVELEG